MNIFTEISIILVIATAVAGVIYLLRQPLIIGHIITGLIVGPRLLDVLRSTDVINAFAEIGIALLLFIVGLGLNPKLIREVGGVAFLAGTGQIVFTWLFGFLIAAGLGFPTVQAIYIAIALTFSSTIIVVKILSDRGDMQRLYGKIALGILLVQDVVATFVLIFISSFSNGANITQLVSATLLQGVALIVLAVFVSLYILPALSSFFARSQEFLFLFAIAWGFGLATLFYVFGFSVEIGALVAGVTLSLSPYSIEIASKMKPLRDFFIVLFFILLGSQMTLTNITAIAWPLTILSLFVLVGNPLIVLALMGVIGYGKRTGFFTGLALAQISEFSLIIIMLAVKVGHVPESILSLITFVGLVTIAASTYLITYADKLYVFFAPALSLFEKTNARREPRTNGNYDIILFGHNRIGYDFIAAFTKLKKKFLVVDFDPAIIKNLTVRNIACCYGDADDVEFLAELNLKKIKMAVSTIPEGKTNLLLIKQIRAINKSAVIIVIAHSIAHAETLYAAGATYVILPHFLGGAHTAAMIEKLGLRKASYAAEQRKHLAYIKQRQTLGHEHPRHERS